MSRKRVVLVCMVDSIHVARWIAQFEPTEVEFVLFPSTPNRRVHSMIKDLRAKNNNIKIVPFGGKLSIPLWGMDLVVSDYVRGILLRRVLKREQPDFVHALELQHGGYIASRALEDESVKTSFIATNYGSDIYWFQQFPKHLAKIKKLLARADRYSAECNRDVELARKHGFTGNVMPVFPNAGGFAEDQFDMPLSPASTRKIITIKGYDGWVGRARQALKAIALAAECVDGCEIVIFGANQKTRILAKRLARQANLKFQVYGKGELSHKQILTLFSQTKLYIGLSLSDGASTSFLEAVMMGAITIQSGTACAKEYLHVGADELVLANFEPAEVARVIRRVFFHSDEFDRLAFTNATHIRRQLGEAAIGNAIKDFYKPVIAESSSSRR